MKVIYGLNKIKKFKDPVVALGVFDGVHIGHRRILKAVVEKANEIKGTSAVVTFFPHPQKKKSLYSLEHRLSLISAAGIDVCIVIKFNKVFSRIAAEDFVKDILTDKVGCRYIFVGRNFRFGKNAQGDFRLLDKLSHCYNFKLKAFDIIRVNGRPVSSTYIRRLITQGKLKPAQKLLARPVSILGTVIRGSSRARSLGFPTANIDPHHEVLPPSGIYAASIIFHNMKFNGVCYIGRKPTFERRDLQHIEAYIFNFNKNIYGKSLEVQFIKKIRDDRKFESPESLAEQVRKDINVAKKIILRQGL